MSPRRENRSKRCKVCLVHSDNCYCQQVKELKLKTKVSIILFKKEKFLPSNTANLSARSLPNSELFYRGYRDIHLESSFIDEKNYHPLYLFPSDDSVELTPEFLKGIKKPINLVVPDGTWSQAKKIHNREPLLREIPRVRVTTNDKSIYTLRRQVREKGLCTHEAIAHALGIIEEQKTKEILMENLHSMVKAHEKYRVIFERQKFRNMSNK